MKLPYNKIRSGDIIAVSRKCSIWRPSTWLAARIQSTTKSKWNHVGILVWQDTKLVCIEALWSGGVVATNPLRYLSDDYEIAIARPSAASITQAATAAGFAKQRIGSAYDKIKILNIRAMQLILGSDVVEIINAPENDDVYICSELVIRAWRAAGIKLGEAFSGPGEVMKHATIYWEY